MFKIFCLDLNFSGSPADNSGWEGPRLGHIENSILIFDLLSMGIIVGNGNLLGNYFHTLIVAILVGNGKKKESMDNHFPTLKMDRINTTPTSSCFFFNEPLQSQGLPPVRLNLKKTC